MSAIIYKCPNCGAGVIFDPAKQKFTCEYCSSDFEEQELIDFANSQAGPAPTVLYSCPSCGAEIITDENTAVTFCYYCHNPVVLSERLEGKYEPDLVVPFAVNRQDAITRFLDWAGKKKFVPKAYFAKEQIEKITGIYFPCWVTDCDADLDMQAHAINVRVWRSGDMEYTETKHFQVRRTGGAVFRGIINNALCKEQEQWLEYIEPYQLKDAKPYNPGYLLGFQAEKRNIEKEEYTQKVRQEVEQQAQMMIRKSVTGYTNVSSVQTQVHVKNEKWYYTLLPLWMLTYKDRSGKIYVYAMNGQTGKVSGILPLDRGKLWRLFFGVSGSVAAVLFLITVIGGLLV